MLQPYMNINWISEVVLCKHLLLGNTFEIQIIDIFLNKERKKNVSEMSQNEVYLENNMIFLNPF